MTILLHHPDHHRTGKLDAKPARTNVEEFIDLEQAERLCPQVVDNTRDGSIPLAMYLNNHEGCCTFAGIGNTLRVNSGGKVQLTDGDIQTGYVDVTRQEGAAFNPATGANDNGCAEIDVLDYWARVGVGGNKLLGHAGVNIKDPVAVKVVCWLAGSVYPGWQLSIAQQSQAIWDAASGASGQPGSWGGHCAPIFAVTPSGLILGTWAIYKPATFAFASAYGDEGHMLITSAWLEANVGNPLINQAALTSLLAKFQREP